MGDDQKPPTWAIYTNTPIPDIEAARLYRILAGGGLAIVPGNARIERIPPPAVFLVRYFNILHEVDETKAIFASQEEAEAWLDNERPGWRETGSSVIPEAERSYWDIERWELGPPQKERDE